MSARTQTISRQHPLCRRGTDLVIGWGYRLTLTEGDQSIYNDFTAMVPQYSQQRPLAEWTQAQLTVFLEKVLAVRPPELLDLHQRLNDRLAVDERHDFDPGSLAP